MSERSPEALEIRNSPERLRPVAENQPQSHNHFSDVLIRWFYAYNDLHIDIEMPEWLLLQIDHDLVVECEICMSRYMHARELPTITVEEILSGISQHSLNF